MEIRSFLAFELPVDIKRIVARVSGEIRNSIRDVRWIKVDNIHLTVAFLGNIQTEEITAVGDAVREVCLGFGPFNISLKGIGVFPNSRNPRVLWIGLDGDSKRMSHFRDALQKQLKPFGVKEEKRKFNPHLTLGRARKRKMDFHLDDITSRYNNVISPVCTIHELIFFKSDLKPGGAVYTKLESFGLTNDD